jgi:hypothetical protein
MSFEVDLSHVPSIPGLESVVSVPSSGIAESTKDLVNSLTEDRSALFQNPMVNVITTANNTLDSLESKLQSIANGDEINDRITSGEANTFLSGAGILNIQTSLSNLLSHTNRLSGVLKGQGIELPGLEEVMSIGKQMNDYVNILSAGSGCLNIIGGSTGLYSQTTVNSETNKIADMIERISRGAATIADITEMCADMSNLVQGIIDKDSQFLQNCVTQLRDAALAAALEYVFQDPCAKFILETVSNNSNPGGILTKLVGPVG